MKNKFYYLLLFITAGICLACEDENNTQFPSALKVVHAVLDTPAVHVGYMGMDITISADNRISFGEALRTGIPANTSRNIQFISAADSITQVYVEELNLSPGDIRTFFLVGSNAGVEGVLIEDQPLTLTDSLIGVRFINLSPDSSPVTIGIAGQTDQIGSSLAYKSASDYNEFEATVEAGSYTFEFKNDQGAFLASGFIDPLPVTTNAQKLVFKNMTFALIGPASNPSVIRIDDFKNTL